jgi:hypothetical protein
VQAGTVADLRAARLLLAAGAELHLSRGGTMARRSVTAASQILIDGSAYESWSTAAVTVLRTPVVQRADDMARRRQLTGRRSIPCERGSARPGSAGTDSGDFADNDVAAERPREGSTRRATQSCFR